MKRTIFFLGISLLFLGSAGAQDQPKSPPGTETILIPSDMLPPPSAEKVVPKTPFFTEPSTGNEVLEYVEALRHRVDALEITVENLKSEVEKFKGQAPDIEKKPKD